MQDLSSFLADEVGGLKVKLGIVGPCETRGREGIGRNMIRCQIAASFILTPYEYWVLIAKSHPELIN
jgi:hypothetical protein